MNEESIQKAKIHNSVLGILSIACTGAIIESVTQGWEFWVPPLIVAGLIAAWGFHIIQYSTRTFRENYYLIFSMLVSFYHGVHETSFFDIVVITVLLMGTMTMVGRREFLTLSLAEYLVLIGLQIYLAISHESLVFDTLVISRIILHVVAVICMYKVMTDILKKSKSDSEELSRRNKEKAEEKVDMEDFLVNISHELRTPVNVINGLSALILKKEERDDVISIRDAGLRLSRQIEDIQDYSEIQRGDVVLEEDRYMITSLLNDMVADEYILDRKGELDLIIDLDPKVPALMLGDVRKIRKILRHLLSNAFKFTSKGGVYLKIKGIPREYGVNLIIEVTDTGAGMGAGEVDKLSKGLYQGNKKRNRSTGGIGLGLSIVYGFVRRMEGFVTIESARRKGTRVRVSLAQVVVDQSPCLAVETDRFLTVIFHVIPEKYKVADVREYYKNMAASLAEGLRVNVYSAPSIAELEKLVEKGGITHIFMGEEEYMEDPAYYDELARRDIIVAVSANEGFMPNIGSRVVVMPKPLYGFPVVKILSGKKEELSFSDVEVRQRPQLEGVKALVVDDEPMNLVVASGLFKDYGMVIETADSGYHSIEMYMKKDYDLIFMDHMMPGMDGVEAMKRLRDIAAEKGRTTKFIVLTANAISGAREMFLREGFDGFISKPINIPEFERVVNSVLSGTSKKEGLNEFN